MIGTCPAVGRTLLLALTASQIGRTPCPPPSGWVGTPKGLPILDRRRCHSRTSAVSLEVGMLACECCSYFSELFVSKNKIGKFQEGDIYVVFFQTNNARCSSTSVHKMRFNSVFVTNLLQR